MLTSNGLVDKELDAANAPLNDEERERLNQLEVIVEQGLQTFYEVGKALIEIRDRKLYRESQKTFEDYCRYRWSIGRQRAYQFISAAQVMENLSTNGRQIPTSERQVRPLSGLSPELQREIWQEALESAPNGIPSGAIVQSLVDKKLSSGKMVQEVESSPSELEQLRLENKRLKEHIRQKDLERERRAAEVVTELERLREENRQLRAELRQWERDWDLRIAQEREKIRAEIKAEYQHIIDDMTAKYEGVLARLEAIERGNK
ncbi:MAG TPA: hypothetical protein DCY88_15845 [Cyanobacteria bacterium UBA11372]|nr:hypothetical protein [Cyanobacteria bacterium UBA11372]